MGYQGCSGIHVVVVSGGGTVVVVRWRRKRRKRERRRYAHIGHVFPGFGDDGRVMFGL